ncbi:MAG TPA: AAA family ATPase [Longimicrobium sp.]|nr:AAA family ATPase [Longimicrobium sp.]
MSPILLLTGAPGTGKTTVAALLARDAAMGLHLPGDLFFTFPAHPLSPYRPEAHAQNEAVLAALARTAAAFAAHGYDVVVEGIFGPWFLPLLARELLPAGHPVDYVVLRVPLETALRRVHAREGPAREHVVRQMHAALAELGPYAGQVVETDGRTPQEVAEEVRRRRAEGAFALGLSEAVARGAGDGGETPAAAPA